MLYDQTLNFTDRSWDVLYGVIEEDYFQENEARAIYAALRKKMKFVPFGDYLKRYVYRAAGLTGPFDQIDEQVYRQIIVDSFRETGTPASFEPNTAKLSMLVKNWLSQQAVRRNVVLLLGFGLRMTEDEVNEMLLKALQEQCLQEADPMEKICAFCYRYQLSFSSYERLSQEYARMVSAGAAGANGASDSAASSGTAAPADPARLHSPEEAELMRELAELSTGKTSAQVTTEKAYRALYAQAQEMIANMYNTTGTFAGSLAADITESDLEHVLSSAIPTDRHGNLVPASYAQLDVRFAEHRISRQRLHCLLSGKTQINRYDLITLSFFIWSQKAEVAFDPKRRYIGFINATNQMLKDCSFGEIYPVNPYECFLLMCLLSETPLSTYAEVWELAHAKEPVKRTRGKSES